MDTITDKMLMLEIAETLKKTIQNYSRANDVITSLGYETTYEQDRINVDFILARVKES